MEKIVVRQRGTAESQDVLFHRTCKTFLSSFGVKNTLTSLFEVDLPHFAVVAYKQTCIQLS